MSGRPGSASSKHDRLCISVALSRDFGHWTIGFPETRWTTVLPPADFNEGGRMLTFCRKPGEKFVIGNDISVTVTRIQGKRVWLRFDAPNSVPIFREELLRNTQLVGARAH
jgi:carbon storage regulator CsrA